MKHILIAVLLFALGCGRMGRNVPDLAGVKQAASETLNNYHRDINARGLAAEFEYLDSAPEFFWIPPGYDHALDYREVGIAIRRNMENAGKYAMQWDQLNVIPISEDAAVYHGRIHSVYTDTAGLEFKTVLMETGYLRKRETGWKLSGGETVVWKGEEENEEI